MNDRSGASTREIPNTFSSIPIGIILPGRTPKRLPTMHPAAITAAGRDSKQPLFRLADLRHQEENHILQLNRPDVREPCLPGRGRDFLPPKAVLERWSILVKLVGPLED